MTKATKELHRNHRGIHQRVIETYSQTIVPDTAVTEPKITLPNALFNSTVGAMTIGALGARIGYAASDRNAGVGIPVGIDSGLISFLFFLKIVTPLVYRIMYRHEFEKNRAQKRIIATAEATGIPSKVARHILAKRQTS